MTSRPPEYYEDLQGRVRGVLIDVADKLDTTTAGLVDELIEANESGVALEILCEVLLERRTTISLATFASVEHLFVRMRLELEPLERLRSLVG